MGLLVRSRLILQLISVVVLMVLTVLGVRACGTSSPSSVLNPANLARNGLAGICANEQAVAAAGGSGAGAPGTALSPSLQSRLQVSDPAGLHALEQASGGPLTCAATTTTGP